MSNRWSRTLVALVCSVIISAVSATGALAATVAVDRGTAVLTAAPSEGNDIRADDAGGTALTISDAGAPLTAGAGCLQVDANSVSCVEDYVAPLALVVHAGDRDDHVVVDDRLYARDVTIFGGEGDDTALVSNSIGTSPVLEGGSGDDDLTANMNDGGDVPVLRGEGGSDVLRLLSVDGGQAFDGSGDDRIIQAGSIGRAPLLLDGGTGDDTYTFLRKVRAVGIVPAGGVDTLDQSGARFGALVIDLTSCPGCVEQVIGTPLADLIIGDGGAQAISGGDGDDVLDGGGGPDSIAGGGGDDRITSKDRASDVVACGDGFDTVLADPRDRLARDCEGVARRPLARQHVRDRVR